MCIHDEKRNNCRNPFSSDGESDVVEGTLSGILPDELVMTILACLPLPNLLRYRSVCKKWNSLLKDQSFQEIRARVHGGEHLYRQYIKLMERSPSFAGSQVVSSVGSLLLLTANENNAIHIIDPSKATLIQIPQVPTLGCNTHKYIGCGMVKNDNVLSKTCRNGSRYYTVGMVMNPHTRVFNVLAVSKGSSGPVTLQLYDSSLDSWRVVGSILPEPDLISVHIVGVVLLDSPSHNFADLHCLSVGFNEINLAIQFRVFWFDKQRRVWKKLADSPSRVRYENRNSPLLFQHRGRLLFAGATAHGNNKTFYIWEYDSEKLEWRVFDSLPPELSSQVQLGGPQTGMASFSHACGDHLCIGTYPHRKSHTTVSSSATSPLDGRCSSVTSVVIYNLVERSWRLWPRPEAENFLVSWLRRTFLYDSSSRMEWSKISIPAPLDSRVITSKGESFQTL